LSGSYSWNAWWPACSVLHFRQGHKNGRNCIVCLAMQGLPSHQESPLWRLRFFPSELGKLFGWWHSFCGTGGEITQE
jgi:hypothetical protein